MLELLLGQIPEAIYFALFMIFTKDLKQKRILFIILMVLEYLLFKHFIHFSMYFQIAYTFFTYIILKILYKEKAQITDIFTFTIGSVFLIITSAICYLVCKPNTELATVINRIVIFLTLFILNYRLNKIQVMYKKIWNKDKNKTKIKSTTFRSINIIIFNIIFYIINTGMLYALFLLEGK